MSNQLIPNEEFQTYNSLDGTEGGFQTESPSNQGTLTLRSLNVSSVSNNDLDSSYNLGETSVITDYDTLMVFINELLIRFDASPSYYQKEDYKHLIRTLTDSLRYLYTDSSNINIDITDILSTLDDLTQALDSKVDKVTGKGLSTNDLTNTLKSLYDLAYQHISLENNPHNINITQIGAEAAGTAQALIDDLNLGDIITHDASEFALALTEDENYVSDLEKSNLHAPGSDNQVAADFDIKDLTDSTSLRDTWSGKADANHNHNLADLTERSYNSLTDKPNLSLLEDIIDIQWWLDSEQITGILPTSGDIWYDLDSKLLYTYIDDAWMYIPFQWKIYINQDALTDTYGKFYVYNGSELSIIPDGLVLGTTVDTAYNGQDGKTAYDHAGTTGNPHGTTASDVGASPLGHNHSGEGINPDYIVLDEEYTDTTMVALPVGSLFYNVDQLAWLLKTSTTTYLNLGEENTYIAKNGDGVTHLEGQVTYVTSGGGNLDVMTLASSANGKIDALLTQDVLHTGNGRGMYCFGGKVRTFPYSNVIKSTDNENTWIEGADLFLCSEAGRYSTIKEAAPAKCSVVGKITQRNGANISVSFRPFKALATTDLSDWDGTTSLIADTEKLFIRKANGVIQEITKSDFYAVLDDYFAKLSGGNTFSGVQTFSDNIKVTKIVPNADGTTAIQITKADGTTAILTIDSTNLKAILSGQLEVTSSAFPVITGIRTTTATTGLGAAIALIRRTTGNMADTFGGGFVVSVADDTVARADLGGFYASRDGADDKGKVQILVNQGNGVTGALIPVWTIDWQGNINSFSGKYVYNAASLTADTVNDIRTSNVAGVKIEEICTVANATKGGGTWVKGKIQTGSLFADKIIPNSDTTGVVIRNAADGADAFKFNSNGLITFINDGGFSNSSGNFSLGGGAMNLSANSAIRFFNGQIRFIKNGGTSINTTDNPSIAISPETTLDVNGSTTLRDWVYLNNGTHTGDAVGDRRYKVVSDVFTLQRCTVLNATRGSGTWVDVYTNDLNGFVRDEYDDILPGMGWVDAAGGAAPDTAAHTIAGIAVNFKAFDGGTTTEAMTNAFEITHAIDIDALNRATDPLIAEIHTHGMAATTGSGVVKIFYDLVYQPVNAAPIAWGTFSNLITINANEQYWHKLGGVELTKPSSGYNIGDQIIVKYYRVPTDAQDTYAGDWLFKQCALHMPLNSNGSRQRYVK